MAAWSPISWLRPSLVLIFLAGGAGWWHWKSKEQASEGAQTPLVATISFTERRLRAVERQLQLRPKDPEAYAELAAAYMEKAREMGDGAFYRRAEAACQKALELAPDNYSALRMVSWVYSGQHRFREALAAARRALERDSRDPLNYGTLGDALLELGEYQEGAEAIQKMVDLRPDVSSYARAAYIRELFGDIEGAIEIMGRAVRAASSRDHGHNAWCRVQLSLATFFSTLGVCQTPRLNTRPRCRFFRTTTSLSPDSGALERRSCSLTRQSVSIEPVLTSCPRTKRSSVLQTSSPT